LFPRNRNSVILEAVTAKGSSSRQIERIYRHAVAEVPFVRAYPRVLNTYPDFDRATDTTGELVMGDFNAVAI
jgi:hypothetical protein